MKEKSLLIITKDKRQFLTHQKQLQSIIEFAKTFNSEIYLVTTENQKILGPKALAEAICNQEYDDKPECVRIKRIYPKIKRDRKLMLSEAANIRMALIDQFFEGQVVSLKDMKDKYKKSGVTDACLCNHLSAVRKQLEREGQIIRKVGGGQYCIS